MDAVERPRKRIHTTLAWVHPPPPTVGRYLDDAAYEHYPGLEGADRFEPPPGGPFATTNDRVLPLTRTKVRKTAHVVIPASTLRSGIPTPLPIPARPPPAAQQPEKRARSPPPPPPRTTAASSAMREVQAEKPRKPAKKPYDEAAVREYMRKKRANAAKYDPLDAIKDLSRPLHSVPSPPPQANAAAHAVDEDKRAEIINYIERKRTLERTQAARERKMQAERRRLREEKLKALDMFRRQRNETQKRPAGAVSPGAAAAQEARNVSPTSAPQQQQQQVAPPTARPPVESAVPTTFAPTQPPVMDAGLPPAGAPFIPTLSPVNEREPTPVPPPSAAVAPAPAPTARRGSYATSSPMGQLQRELQAILDEELLKFNSTPTIDSTLHVYAPHSPEVTAQQLLHQHHQQHDVQLPTPGHLTMSLAASASHHSLLHGLSRESLSMNYSAEGESSRVLSSDQDDGLGVNDVALFVTTTEPQVLSDGGSGSDDGEATPKLCATVLPEPSAAVPSQPRPKETLDYFSPLNVFSRLAAVNAASRAASTAKWTGGHYHPITEHVPRQPAQPAVDRVLDFSSIQFAVGGSSHLSDGGVVEDVPEDAVATEPARHHGRKVLPAADGSSLLHDHGTVDSGDDVTPTPGYHHHDYAPILPPCELTYESIAPPGSPPAPQPAAFDRSAFAAESIHLANVLLDSIAHFGRTLGPGAFPHHQYLPAVSLSGSVGPRAAAPHPATEIPATRTAPGFWSPITPVVVPPLDAEAGPAAGPEPAPARLPEVQATPVVQKEAPPLPAANSLPAAASKPALVHTAAQCTVAPLAHSATQAGWVTAHKAVQTDFLDDSAPPRSSEPSSSLQRVDPAPAQHPADGGAFHSQQLVQVVAHMFAENQHLVRELMASKLQQQVLELEAKVELLQAQARQPPQDFVLPPQQAAAPVPPPPPVFMTPGPAAAAYGGRYDHLHHAPPQPREKRSTLRRRPGYTASSRESLASSADSSTVSTTSNSSLVRRYYGSATPRPVPTYRFEPHEPVALEELSRPASAAPPPAAPSASEAAVAFVPPPAHVAEAPLPQAVTLPAQQPNSYLANDYDDHGSVSPTTPAHAAAADNTFFPSQSLLDAINPHHGFLETNVPVDWHASLTADSLIDDGLAGDASKGASFTVSAVSSYAASRSGSAAVTESIVSERSQSIADSVDEETADSRYADDEFAESIADESEALATVTAALPISASSGSAASTPHTASRIASRDQFSASSIASEIHDEASTVAGLDASAVSSVASAVESVHSIAASRSVRGSDGAVGHCSASISAASLAPPTAFDVSHASIPESVASSVVDKEQLASSSSTHSGSKHGLSTGSIAASVFGSAPSTRPSSVASASAARLSSRSSKSASPVPSLARSSHSASASPVPSLARSSHSASSSSRSGERSLASVTTGSVAEQIASEHAPASSAGASANLLPDDLDVSGSFASYVASNASCAEQEAVSAVDAKSSASIHSVVDATAASVAYGSIASVASAPRSEMADGAPSASALRTGSSSPTSSVAESIASAGSRRSSASSTSLRSATSLSKRRIKSASSSARSSAPRSAASGSVPDDAAATASRSVTESIADVSDDFSTSAAPHSVAAFLQRSSSRASSSSSRRSTPPSSAASSTAPSSPADEASNASTSIAEFSSILAASGASVAVASSLAAAPAGPDAALAPSQHSLSRSSSTSSRRSSTRTSSKTSSLPASPVDAASASSSIAESLPELDASHADASSAAALTSARSAAEVAQPPSASSSSASSHRSSARSSAKSPSAKNSQIDDASDVSTLIAESLATAEEVSVVDSRVRVGAEPEPVAAPITVPAANPARGVSPPPVEAGQAQPSVAAADQYLMDSFDAPADEDMGSALTRDPLSRADPAASLGLDRSVSADSVESEIADDVVASNGSASPVDQSSAASTSVLPSALLLDRAGVDSAPASTSAATTPLPHVDALRRLAEQLAAATVSHASLADHAEPASAVPKLELDSATISSHHDRADTSIGQSSMPSVADEIDDATNLSAPSASELDYSNDFDASASASELAAPVAAAERAELDGATPTPASVAHAAGAADHGNDATASEAGPASTPLPPASATASGLDLSPSGPSNDTTIESVESSSTASSASQVAESAEGESESAKEYSMDSFDETSAPVLVSTAADVEVAGAEPASPAPAAPVSPPAPASLAVDEDLLPLLDTAVDEFLDQLMTGAAADTVGLDSIQLETQTVATAAPDGIVKADYAERYLSFLLLHHHDTITRTSALGPVAHPIYRNGGANQILADLASDFRDAFFARLGDACTSIPAVYLYRELVASVKHDLELAAKHNDAVDVWILQDLRDEYRRAAAGRPGPAATSSPAPSVAPKPPVPTVEEFQKEKLELAVDELLEQLLEDAALEHLLLRDSDFD
ncbi:hypothetical protein H9P43_001416 [Blastocladiella emersonii ATCC 22665]|nr:hypothetical protein H9P43_001416 [Blastocladiella emersonii ATCC 22665]